MNELKLYSIDIEIKAELGAYAESEWEARSIIIDMLKRGNIEKEDIVKIEIRDTGETW